jgi:hypothetical protein
VIATTLVNVVSANATPVEATPVTGQDGLRAVGFDESVATANGYVIVTRPDGFLDSVPEDQAEAARSGLVKPEGALVPTAGHEFTTAAQDYKYGNCGWSMVSMSALGGARATMDTGAHVRPDWDGIWDVNWRVNISDNGGSSQQTGYSAPRGTHDFNPAARTLNLTRGPAIAGVPYYSYVLLEDGTVCFSLAPSVSITIT